MCATHPFVLVLALVVGPIADDPPPHSDAEVERVVADFLARKKAISTGSSMRAEDYQELMDEALGHLEIARLTASQIVRLEELRLLGHGDRPARLHERLHALADPRTPTGATVALLELRQLAAKRDATTEEQEQALTRLLEHPGLGGALLERGAAFLFGALADLPDRAVTKKHAKEILALEKLFGDAHPRLALGLSDFWTLTHRLTEDDSARGRIREQLVALGKRAPARRQKDPVHFRDPEVEFLSGMVAFLDGRAARGELLGHSAPELDFEWSSRAGLHKLSSLRGKVVVLDFWATWCGPCVGSIPAVRKLQQHYAEFPVEIVGVTSLQGTHVGPQGAVETEGDPKREHALMSEYIEEKDITWPIAFSRQDVYNPDYGVRGIPHVVIIDPKGVVRHRGLHPGAPLPEKAKLIDGILTEFGLPHPPPPKETEDDGG